MFRSIVAFVVFSQLFGSQLYAQPIVDKDLEEYAMVLAASGTALENGNGKAASDILVLTKESLRGTPFRLLMQLAAEPDPKHSMAGKSLPKPDHRFAHAVLHPGELTVAFACDLGVVALYDLANPDKEPFRQELTASSSSGTFPPEQNCFDWKWANRSTCRRAMRTVPSSFGINVEVHVISR